MGEIVQLSSSFSSPNPKKMFHHKKHLVVEVEQCDHISKLPDEVLSSIVSLLTLTEAARTSVLSHRWKPLWYSFHGTFDIDAPKRVNMLPPDTMFQAMCEYLSSMSLTLPLLSSPFLDAFIVRCTSLNKFCVSHLDLYVQYAMKKRIKRLDLNLDPEVSAFVRDLLYHFPVEFYVWIKTPCGLDNISSLTSISLNYVNVSDDLIQHFLVNCPLLESLRVRDSSELLNPKISGGTTLKLKYLELLSSELESVELCTPNLLTFATNSEKVKLRIKNAPKLVELSIFVHVVNERPASVSSYLPRLEKLTLDFSIFNFYNIQLMHQFDELKKLQHLTWKVGVYHDEDTIKLNSLIEASPILNKFTLVIFQDHPSTKEMVSKVTSKNRHQCLRVLEIDGFTGADAEVKLVKYILANTTSLEQIILDIRGPYYRRRFRWDDYAPHLELSKRRALHLKECLPPTVSLLII